MNNTPKPMAKGRIEQGKLVEVPNSDDRSAATRIGRIESIEKLVNTTLVTVRFLDTNTTWEYDKSEIVKVIA